MDAPDSEARPEANTPTRWYQRALPVTLLVLLVVGVAAVASPAARDQLELSLTRQPAAYLGLYFAKPTASGATAVCSRRGDTVRVRFVVRSHLRDREAVAWRAVVQPNGRGARAARARSSADLDPGEAARVARSLPVPSGTGYLLSVELPGHAQHLWVRCPGGRR